VATLLFAQVGRGPRRVMGLAGSKDDWALVGGAAWGLPRHHFVTIFWLGTVLGRRSRFVLGDFWGIYFSGFFEEGTSERARPPRLGNAKGLALRPFARPPYQLPRSERSLH